MRLLLRAFGRAEDVSDGHPAPIAVRQVRIRDGPVPGEAFHKPSHVRGRHLSPMPDSSGKGLRQGIHSHIRIRSVEERVVDDSACRAGAAIAEPAGMPFGSRLLSFMM